MKYLLPCDKCGEKTPIDLNQAGQQTTCQCGQTLEIPSLRGIRGLEVIQAAGTSIPTSTSSVGGRIVFVVGVIVCVLGLAAVGVAVFQRTQMVIPARPVFDVERSNADIDAKTPAQAWDEWARLRAEGLGHYRPPAYVEARGKVKAVWTAMAIAAGGAVIGLLVAVGACLFPAAKRN